MTSIYGFSGGPKFRGMTSGDFIDAAMDQPLSLMSTLYETGVGDMLETFGIGTAIKETTIPAGRPEGQTLLRQAGSALVASPLLRFLSQQVINTDQKALSEDDYKRSPHFRKNIPWDAGMTEARAKALADWDDHREIRKFYGAKRPITAFIGGLMGQALDPINYIPIAGPAVKAAAIARAGRIGGAALTGSLDAAANTAIFGVATRETRRPYGSDVSWQATVSEIAVAALIGSAFGGIAGALEARGASRAAAEAQARLGTLRTTQEARIALNEAIDAVVRGEPVALSPNATEPMARAQKEIIAYHGSPHDFDRFDMSKIGTGEGAQVYGHGLYFAEAADVAKSYQTDLATEIKVDGNPILRNNKTVGTTGDREVDDFLIAHDGDLDRAISKAREYASEDGVWGRASSEEYTALADKLEALRGRVETTNSGSLYEVGIKAGEDDLLDWDKPISEQPASVQKAIAEIRDIYGSTGTNALSGDMRGGQFYQILSGADLAGSKERAALDLQAVGLKGIRYLDQVSRDSGGGTRNFVIFDDSLIEMRAKNGQAIKQAEARVGKPDDAKAIAEQHAVHPETGEFPEIAEIDQLRAEGRLTAEDEAALEEAQSMLDDAGAYSEALMSVTRCLL